MGLGLGLLEAVLVWLSLLVQEFERSLLCQEFFNSQASLHSVSSSNRLTQVCSHGISGVPGKKGKPQCTHTFQTSAYFMFTIVSLAKKVRWPSPESRGGETDSFGWEEQ